jgi:hypothetical protein
MVVRPVLVADRDVDAAIERVFGSGKAPGWTRQDA